MSPSFGWFISPKWAKQGFSRLFLSRTTDVLKNQIYCGILAEFVHVEDEMVVASIIAAGAGELVDVVLTHFIDSVDDEPCLLLAHILLARHTLHAVEHRSLDEDRKVIRVVAEHIESRTTGNDARLVFGEGLEDLGLRAEDIFGLDVRLVEFILGLGESHLTLEFRPPAGLLTFELLYLVCGQVIAFFEGFDDGFVEVLDT